MLKKISVGGWIACAAALLTLVSLIVYSSNIGAEGYFKNASVSGLVLWTILALVMLVVAIVLKTLDLSDGAAKAIDLIVGALQIGAPVLLALSLINLIAARVEGLGFIYFSNADVILEVQTPANLASATGAIASMVCFGVAMLAALIAAFCNLRKKEA
ncbi:MAG: hypothetical protein K6G17_08615 [Oscillospiraceae bacterium]|nr:hypothetical protein [Oscillospiraceae bacterium]